MTDLSTTIKNKIPNDFSHQLSYSVSKVQIPFPLKEDVEMRKRGIIFEKHGASSN